MQSKNELLILLKENHSWEKKYKSLLQLGKLVKSIPLEKKIDKNLISGCENDVWLNITIDNEQVNIDLYSESRLINGIIYLLLDFIQNQSLDILRKSDLSNILKAYNLPNTLSATKMSGIDSIIKSIEQKLIEV
ncbi:SufE family protein [Paraphotobacterium marinum]|uniref:SufE family protein n=1 Tax=Paraphotobacterium marinum TaxID=1755811 RepID=UPI0039E72DB6